MEHTEKIKTILSKSRYLYPGYLFEIEEYPTMMIVWVRSKSSGLENKKAILKYTDISLVKYEIEKMVNDIEEEELKNVVGWSNKNLIEMNSYLDIRPMSINKYSIVPKELIFQDEKTTVINWNDNTKTIVKCSDDDTFSPEAGIALCYMKRFMTDNDSERFHRLLKGLISKSKVKNSSKQEYKSSLFDCAEVIKAVISTLYTEENHDIDTGTSCGTSNNDPDGSAVEVES